MENQMTKVKTKEEAISKAIDFQAWQSNQSLSYEEVANWGRYFNDLANEFDLVDEFSENGLI